MPGRQIYKPAGMRPGADLAGFEVTCFEDVLLMNAHSIDAQIVQSLPLLGKEEKSSLLKVIRSFLMLKNATIAEPGFELDEYNREIDEAEAESERDGFISHEDMKAEFAQWKQERIK